MRAANLFAKRLAQRELLERTQRIQVELFGSLAFTGKGHGSDSAVILGLEGETPETVDPDATEARIAATRSKGAIAVLGQKTIPFTEKQDLLFQRKERLPLHSNGMRFAAFDLSGQQIEQRVYYSIGGGFVVNEQTASDDVLKKDETVLPFHFTSGAEILEMSGRHGLSLGQMMLENEKAWRSEAEVSARLGQIWEAMQSCVKRGCERQEPELPGKLRVKRRAPTMCRRLSTQPQRALRDPLTILDWVNLYALAVNEENATGGRVVTAPTNGAAGIIPAVLHYYNEFVPTSHAEGIRRFLLAAGGIGILYKENASISGAEAGCQGEVGVACSMAAAGLTEALGGTIEQVEEAAEIGMEHNLGLTCDPVGGLVQIPCIERNAMGAIKAINASRMALQGDGKHRVPLDKVIETMRQTGKDMKTKYKETARGGLAVNVIEC